MSADTTRLLPYPAPETRRPQIANRPNMLHIGGADAEMKHLSKYCK